VQFSFLFILPVIAPFCVCPADTYEVCNVATLLPAYQTSDYSDGGGTYVASYATDGNLNTAYHLGCAVTNLHTNPWWSVDLGLPLTVTGVFLTNRDDAGA